MSKKKILCYVLLTAMLVNMFAAGEVSVAAEQQKPAYSNLADAKSRKGVLFCQRESLPKQQMPG